MSLDPLFDAISTRIVTVERRVRELTRNDPFPKDNRFSSLSPGPTNDITEGYSPGSIWINRSSLLFFVCADPAEGAAIWINGAGGSGRGPTLGTGLGLAITKHSAVSPYSITTDDHTVLLDATSNDVSAVLPSAAASVQTIGGIDIGDIYQIRRIDYTGGKTATVTTTGGDLILGIGTRAIGTLSYGLLWNDCITVQSNGSEWYII